MKLTILKVKNLFGAAALSAFALMANTASAVVVDLTAVDSGTINGAIFSINELQPAGSGVIDPFLTIQQNGSGGPEQGYNSSTLPFDTKRPTYTHEIKLGDLGQVTIGGTAYYQFVVDVNEPNNRNSLISLDSLKIYTSSTLQNSTSTTPVTAGSGTTFDLFNGSLGTLRYDMSNPYGTNYVLYDDKHHGSGQADINIYIPVSLFAGAQATDYLYMYQAWGFNAAADWEANAGYEETFALLGAAPIPEVPAFLPLGGVLGLVVGANYLRRRRLNAAA